jgi:hypothetical protein
MPSAETSDETIIAHIIRHGIAAPGQPAPRPEIPGDTHASTPRYNPPPTIKQDPQ